MRLRSSVQRRTELGKGCPSGGLLIKKVEEKEDGRIPAPTCNCEDIRLDPSGISDPAIMRLLLGEVTAPFFLLSIQSFKKYKL